MIEAGCVKATELNAVGRENLGLPITNADRIRSMSDEELADWLATAIAKHYDSEAVVPSVDSVLWLDWLRREV